MAEFLVIQRILAFAETPEVAAHVPQSVEVGVDRQLELLFEVDDLLASFYLQ